MNFGFLIFDGIEELDLFGPWEMVAMWSRYADGPERCFTVAETIGPIECNMGTVITPTYCYDSCPPFDYLLIPGGEGTRSACTNEKLIFFIKEKAAGCKNILSVCTGSFVLHATGLLDAHTATTHWGALAELRQCPNVTVTNQRFVKSGKIWTSAGVSAGIDMILAFIAEQAGDDAAGAVQLYAEYYPSRKRYGNAHLTEQAPRYLDV